MPNDSVTPATVEPSAERRFAEARGYVPRYHSKEAYGNWWVKDADDDRIICMCNRQSDSDAIAKLLNGKAHNESSSAT